MSSLPLQEPDGDRDDANQKNRRGYEGDCVWRDGVHGRDGRRETLRICFDLDLISAYRTCLEQAGKRGAAPGNCRMTAIHELLRLMPEILDASDAK